jgi:S-phase kinase-associated protein 1
MFVCLSVWLTYLIHTKTSNHKQEPKEKEPLFELPHSVAVLSHFVRDSLEIEDGDEPPETITLPVPNVTAEVLEKVVEFMKHYQEEQITPIQTPLRSNTLADLVQAWYADFVKVPRTLLFDMVAAANFMDIKPLLDLTCLATSILIKGKRYVVI